MPPTTRAAFDDSAMIRNPNKWPCWPYLPLKRGNYSLEDKNLGFLYVGPTKDGRWIVHHAYMFDPPKGVEGAKNTPKTEYSSTEELLADGWVVD